MVDIATSGAGDIGRADTGDWARPSVGKHVALENVSLGYRAGKRRVKEVFTGLNLDIAQGEFLVIVGPSGCGKTTILEAVAGLLPVLEGQISLAGQRIDGPSPERSLVFQAPSLLPWRTVRGNVLFALQAQRKLSRENVAHADALIELVGLSQHSHLYPRELSGGMKQRVNLARALATQPEVILLDEPFAAVDAQTRDVLQQELLRVWQAESGVTGKKTAIFITHDVEEAVFLADRVIVLAGTLPSRILADIRIDMPRPRLSDAKRSARSVSYQDQLLDLLYDKNRATAKVVAKGAAR